MFLLNECIIIVKSFIKVFLYLLSSFIFYKSKSFLFSH
uniref:Uncharacterized protein n=1 Tax=Thuretia quercifolia TaxID=189650 RepID=A0A1Z1MJY9_9FLOR|nr:hypothetical protein [Thuretia quercifolia]ARW66363.1 hypothetical protein [Thuretia quercifolia]